MHRYRSLGVSAPVSAKADQILPLGSLHVPIHWKRIPVRKKKNLKILPQQYKVYCNVQKMKTFS